MVWEANQYPGQIFMASCTELTTQNGVKGFDCINGTLIPESHFGRSTNYTALHAAMDHYGYQRKLDPNAILVPFEQDITIFNDSKLMINHEGCVNTLQYECTDFYKRFGKDGRNQTSPSRYVMVIIE